MIDAKVIDAFVDLLAEFCKEHELERVEMGTLCWFELQAILDGMKDRKYCIAKWESIASSATARMMQCLTEIMGHEAN